MPELHNNARTYSSVEDAEELCVFKSSELRLSEIWVVFCKKKGVFFSIVMFFFVSSVMLAWVLPKVYQAEVVLLPPVVSGIERFNIPDIIDVDDGKITIDDVYAEFKQNLLSSRLRLHFFEENNLLAFFTKKNDGQEPFNVFQKKFDELLTVTEEYNKDQKVTFVTVTLLGSDPELIARWLNGFVEYVNKVTVGIFENIVNEKIRLKKEYLEGKIENIRDISSKRRLDKIAVLEEARRLAEKLDIVEPAKVNIYSYSQTVSNDMGIVTNTVDSIEYLRGSKALSAEIELLKSRKDDDPFILGVRELQMELLFLESVKLDTADVNSIVIDRKAFAEKYPAKPNKILIILMGFFLGLLVANFVLLFFYGQEKNKIQ